LEPYADRRAPFGLYLVTAELIGNRRLREDVEELKTVFSSRHPMKALR